MENYFGKPDHVSPYVMFYFILPDKLCVDIEGMVAIDSFGASMLSYEGLH